MPHEKYAVVVKDGSTRTKDAFYSNEGHLIIYNVEVIVHIILIWGEILIHTVEVHMWVGHTSKNILLPIIPKRIE